MSDRNEPIEDLILPVIPLRDVVVFPYSTIPLVVGRKTSVAALKAAVNNDRKLALVVQKQPDVEQPDGGDLYAVGTTATVLDFKIRERDIVDVLVSCEQRVQLSDLSYVQGDASHLTARCSPLREVPIPEEQVSALVDELLSSCEKYFSRVESPQTIKGTLSSLKGLADSPSRLVDTVAFKLRVDVAARQKLLEILDVKKRYLEVSEIVKSASEQATLNRKIRKRIKSQMEHSHREYMLHEQMKAIQKELAQMGSGNSDDVDEFKAYRESIEKSGMSAEAREKCLSEVRKLQMMQPMSAESSVIRGYLDWILGLPWKQRTRLRRSLSKAQRILERDHHGLNEVKDQIIEHLAVHRRVGGLSKGPILCLVGPPGVGKTSLGASIARATNRKFVRLSLGGVRDEAEIRGHRRTYIGSMPGRIIQKISKAGVLNPLFLLDEIDKMGMDFRGDPASALLEVLDPEQNSHFNDHYLEVDYDLSQVMFLCTANSMDIPQPLADRMEIVRLPGYTEEEKTSIATRHLLPKLYERHGLSKLPEKGAEGSLPEEGEGAEKADKKKRKGLASKLLEKPAVVDEVKIAPEIVRKIIRNYTREAGVRNLERELAKVCRKLVKHLAFHPKQVPVEVTEENLSDYLGVEKFRPMDAQLKEDEARRIGRVVGLAWTPTGGELLEIEAVLTSGTGRHIKTGSLGDVMQESVQAALTVMRSRFQQLGIRVDFYRHNDFHLHVPEGATPKDGPSAGIGICTALVSATTKIPLRPLVAMTGEITLYGRVLPVGGIKEKLLAAQRGGIKTVIIPEENGKDLADIPEKTLKTLEIAMVKDIDQVLEIALEKLPEPLSDESYYKPYAVSLSSDGGGLQDIPQH